MFGTLVSDLQSNVSVSGDRITGKLKYYDDENSDIVKTWGKGNFIALKFVADDDWSGYTSVKVGLNPSAGSGLVDILSDPDKNGVFKVTNKTQRFVVVADGNTRTFDLSGLTLER